MIITGHVQQMEAVMPYSHALHRKERAGVFARVEYFSRFGCVSGVPVAGQGSAVTLMRIGNAGQR